VMRDSRTKILKKNLEQKNENKEAEDNKEEPPIKKNKKNSPANSR
jgi:hypothetical protein